METRRQLPEINWCERVLTLIPGLRDRCRRKAQICLRLHPALKAAIDRAAWETGPGQDQLSVNHWVQLAIVEQLLRDAGTKSTTWEAETTE